MKSVLKMAWNDMQQDFMCSWWKYVIVFLFSFTNSRAFFIKIHKYVLMGKVQGQASILDCFMYLFRGMNEFIPSKTAQIDIPVNFMLFNIMLALLIGNYIVRDMNGVGMQILLRTQSRRHWWFAKCIWCFSVVIAYYSTVYVGCMVSGYMFGGKISGTWNSDILKVIYGINENTQMDKYMYRTYTLLIMASITICFFQMLITLIWNPILGIMAIMVEYIFSVYFMKWYVIGNQLMIMRYEWVRTGGISMQKGFVLDIAFIVGVIIGGNIYFRKKDILNHNHMLGGI